MRVRYESTVEDFIDVAMEQWRRAQAAEPFWRRDPTVGAVMTAVICFLVARPPLASGVLWGAVGLLVGWFAYPAYRTARVRQTTARTMRDWFAGAPTLLIQAEPLATGFWLAQGASEMLFPWRDVSTVVDGARGIELSTRYGVLILVRSRAFAGDAQRSAFLAEVRDHLAGGRTAPA